jgi:hypothetical protein
VSAETSLAVHNHHTGFHTNRNPSKPTFNTKNGIMSRQNCRGSGHMRAATRGIHDRNTGPSRARWADPARRTSAAAFASAVAFAGASDHLGFGRIVALYYHSSTSYIIH